MPLELFLVLHGRQCLYGQDGEQKELISYLPSPCCPGLLIEGAHTPLLFFSMGSHVSVIELECPLDNMCWEGLALAAMSPQ